MTEVFNEDSISEVEKKCLAEAFPVAVPTDKNFCNSTLFLVDTFNEFDELVDLSRRCEGSKYLIIEGELNEN